MGMAASQARLLSITARLNHIELQSQNISNAKIRLSDDTQDASDAYVKALNKTQYLYNYYNTSGDTVSQQLTGAALTQYGELKNQYGLINSAGQILVSERDAINYQNSNTLEEFLDKYGVLADIGEGTTIEYVNPVWLDHHSEYEQQLADWEKLEPDHETYKYSYWEPITPEEYNSRHTVWESEEPDKNDPKYIIPGESKTNELYNKFLDTTAVCFGLAANDKLNCYMHVLVDLIGSGSHTTSSGDTFTVYSDCGSWDWNKTSHTRNAAMEEITTAIKNQNCSGDIIPGGEETITTSYGTVTVGGPTSDSNMSVYQRAVDLLWEVHGEYDSINNTSTGGTASSESLKKFFYFIEHDLKHVTQGEDEFNQELYDQDVTRWEEREPQKPVSKEGYDEEQYNKDVAEWEAKKPIEDTTIEKYLSKTVRVANDLDEAQWYVNLWNRMNGVSNFKGGFGDNGAYDPDAGWASKSMTEQSWAVLKDGDMNSPEYLKYAIENGLITLEQVQFKDISSNEQGIKNASWVSIVFSNAQDITEVKDETAIAKAEVEYNKVLKEVEIKDKQYDSDLKKLDTEHNALQTEYDSIKTVLEKNVERSFKAFNG